MSILFLTTYEYTIKHTFAFPQEITKTDCNYVMASLDGESPFKDLPFGKNDWKLC